MSVSASSLSFQDYQFKIQTPAGIWRWTTRVDLSLANPSYLVRDVITPFGLLRDMVPIPGTVVQEMANSISLLQQQFAPNMLISPTTLSFTVDEGRGVSSAQSVQLTNNGVFGSLLGVSLTTSAPYIAVTVPSVGGLPSNGSGTFGVTVDSTTLVAASSPYAGTVTLQDPAALNNPQTIPVAIVVRPRAIISLSVAALNFAVTKPISGPFPGIPSQTFTITNTGPSGSVLDYQIERLCGCSEWLASFNPPTGTLTSNASQVTTVVVQPPSNMLTGTYTEILRVSGYSLNFSQDVTVTLVIS